MRIINCPVIEKRCPFCEENGKCSNDNPLRNCDDFFNYWNKRTNTLEEGQREKEVKRLLERLENSEKNAKRILNSIRNFQKIVSEITTDEEWIEFTETYDLYGFEEAEHTLEYFW